MSVAGREFIDPFEQAALREYFSSVTAWHGYIRFLGLTAIWDTPDLPIERLFVPPRVSDQLLEPSIDPKSLVNAREVYGFLGKHPRLVLLGDPGSGKSTLLSWLAYRLTFRKDDGLKAAVGPLIPLPMVLREMALADVRTWDDLLRSFLAHEVAGPLRDYDLEPLLKAGQVFVMLDGIDEISSVETRAGLRRAVWEGMRRYPNCRWLMTSRVLGYSEVPFDARARSEDIEDLRRNAPILPRAKEGARRVDGEPAEGIDVAYVAPFDDAQVETFARNWYAVRDSRAGRGDVGADDFLNAIHGAPDTWQLARVPNMLTMMVLVHRNRSVLPHGRARLYEEIAKAYLGGIDAFRKLDSLEEFSYEEKRAWLGVIAYRMQRNRSDFDEGNVLADAGDVRRFLCEAIGPRYGDRTSAIVERFLEFVARRSGLLIPRSEEKLAFVHLSFLEFFAAVHLQSHVTSLDWALGKATNPTMAEVAGFAANPIWEEALLFLFQLLENSPSWAENLYDLLFRDAGNLDEDDQVCSLAAKVATNRFTGLSDTRRTETLVSCWEGSSAWDAPWYGSVFALWQGDRRDLVVDALNRALECSPDLMVRVPSSVASSVAELPCAAIRRLCVVGVSEFDLSSLLHFPRLTEFELDGGQITDLSPLRELKSLQSLTLIDTRVKNLNPLRGLKSLQSLTLTDTRVKNLNPLRGLKSLQSLTVSGTGVTDLSPLKELKSLQSLDLSDTGVTDLSPLKELKSLQSLDLSGTGVTDLSPLKELKSLQSLTVSDTGVTDLSPLKELRSLQSLNLSSTGVTDLSPLKELKSLQSLDLSDTGVTDLSPLKELKSLQSLDPSRTGVRDLRPLRELGSLQILDLDGMDVTDLRPLRELGSLKSLDLFSTGVTDLSPLRELKSLQSLNLSYTDVEDLSSLKELKSLHRLDLSGTAVTDLSMFAGRRDLRILR